MYVQNRRIHNDCAVQFLSSAVDHCTGGKLNRKSMFIAFADVIDKHWLQHGALPALNEHQIIYCFNQVMEALSACLYIKTIKFREIPYEMYYETAARELDSGSYLGLGYRARDIFGGVGDHLHMSGILRVTPKALFFSDPEIKRDHPFAWEVVEKAVNSASSGYWVVSLNI